MKNNFFKSFFLCGILFMINSCGANQAIYNYEIFCENVGSQGTNLIKVYSYAKTVDKAIEQAKHDAVHGILFKGFVGGNNCSSQAPIVRPEELNDNKEFFDNFFKGEYKRFVYLSSDGSVAPKDKLKVGEMYKVGVVISVNKVELRKHLESQKIIKKLGEIFD